ncbi:MAG TPA: DUF2946 family protein [Xanthobacteraceae bacterium]
MIFRRSNCRWVRTLRVALCTIVAMQAFLAAYGTTMAAARATAFDPLGVICHSGDSEQPGNGDNRSPEKLPCIVCAAAAAALGLEPNPAALAAIPFEIAGRISSAPVVIAAYRPPPRAGLSRAPPSFA